ncbi:protein NKG7-like [Anolis carolinensis]|uniref:protein NKG7-like n=1 Tax=Anolis carolinensis TaxID=28377 RepID=UPI000203A490
MLPQNTEREHATVSLRDASSVESQQPNPFLSNPLKFSSGICSAGSLLVQFTSLTTSYWVLESTPKGLVHGGLWRICMGPTCFFYRFHLLAPHIHVARGFLLMACFCGLISLLCICVSFEHNYLYGISVIRTAGYLNLLAGFLIMIGMIVFTAVYRRSKAYTDFLLIFGSSYGLGWASIPMYAMTGILLVLTHKTIVSEL